MLINKLDPLSSFVGQRVTESVWELVKKSLFHGTEVGNSTDGLMRTLEGIIFNRRKSSHPISRSSRRLLLMTASTFVNMLLGSQNRVP